MKTIVGFFLLRGHCEKFTEILRVVNRKFGNLWCKKPSNLGPIKKQQILKSI